MKMPGADPIIEIEIRDIYETGRKSAFTIPFPPTTGNHQYRHSGKRTFLIPAISAYRLQVKTACQGVPLFDAPVSVGYKITMPDKRRRDIGNILKIVDDALQFAGVLADDSLIVEIYARKMSIEERYGL